MTHLRTISRQEALQYEAWASAWWMSWIPGEWFSSLMGSYLAWKVERKYRRVLEWQKLVDRAEGYRKV